MTSPLRIVFAGTPDFAAQHLQALLTSPHQVVGVYTQPDRPAGRGKHLNESAVKQLARQHDLPIEQPEHLKSPDAVITLKNFNADLMVVVAYGVILPEAILNTPKYGCVNVHGSLLPRWRGAAPIQRAILAGDVESGVTIMQMDKGLDTGDILLRQACAITAADTSATLFEKIAALGCQALLESLDNLTILQKNKMPQNHDQASYAEKLSKEEGRICWKNTASIIDRQIRGLNPWPVAFTQLGDERIRVWQAHCVVKSASPGEIIACDDTGLTVGCAEHALCITQLQLAGGKQLPFAEIYKSRQEWFIPGKLFELGV